MIEYPAKDHIFIRKLTDIILENLEDESFGIKELADKVGISHYRLRRRLHSITNKTISQFIRETRLHKALEILQDEDVSASEVAYKVGFGSPAYFNTCFNEFFGYPPGKVKKGDLRNTEEENPIQVTNEENKRSYRRTLVLISSGILTLTFLGYLCYVIIFRNSVYESKSVNQKEKSIAVLPFKNLSNSIDDRYFIDGVMEEILNNLSRIHNLRVISRTSTEQFRESTSSTSEIGKKLDLDYIVEGSGQKYGNTFRLRVQLIEIASDKHLWAETYEQEITETKDIFTVQSQVAQTIAHELNVTITPQEKILIEKTPTMSLTAYDFYQRGSEELAKYPYPVFDEVSVSRAEYLFHKALEYDSTLAFAYIGLANAVWIRWDRENIQLDSTKLNNRLDSMLILADIALSFDPNSAEAYIVRAGYNTIKGFSKQALKDYDKALSYKPNESLIYWFKAMLYEESDILKSFENRFMAITFTHGPELPYMLRYIGYYYYTAGFPEQGKKYIYEALKLDGDSVKSLDYIIDYDSEISGNYTKDIEYFEKRYLKDSLNPLVLMNLGYYNSLLGRYNESLKYFQKYISMYEADKQGYLTINRLMHIGYTYKKNGYTKEAEYWFNKQIKIYQNHLKYVRYGDRILWLYPLAGTYAAMGDKAKAYETLKIFNQPRSFYLAWLMLLKNDPQFSSIRNEPKFQKIVRDVEAKYQAEHECVRKWIEEQGKL